jgi:hypothetical protein
MHKYKFGQVHCIEMLKGIHIKFTLQFFGHSCSSLQILEI